MQRERYGGGHIERGRKTDTEKETETKRHRERERVSAVL